MVHRGGSHPSRVLLRRTGQDVRWCAYRGITMDKSGVLFCASFDLRGSHRLHQWVRLTGGDQWPATGMISPSARGALTLAPPLLSAGLCYRHDKAERAESARPRTLWTPMNMSGHLSRMILMPTGIRDSTLRSSITPVPGTEGR